jgi:hypothetical protein
VAIQLIIQSTVYIQRFLNETPSFFEKFGEKMEKNHIVPVPITLQMSIEIAML